MFPMSKDHTKAKLSLRMRRSKVNTFLTLNGLIKQLSLAIRYVPRYAKNRKEWKKGDSRVEVGGCWE